MSVQPETRGPPLPYTQRRTIRIGITITADAEDLASHTAIRIGVAVEVTKSAVSGDWVRVATIRLGS